MKSRQKIRPNFYEKNRLKTFKISTTFVQNYQDLFEFHLRFHVPSVSFMLLSQLDLLSSIYCNRDSIHGTTHFELKRKLNFFLSSLCLFNKDFFSFPLPCSILKQKCLLEICHFIQVMLVAFPLLVFVLPLEAKRERKKVFFSSRRNIKKWLIIFNY